MERAVGDFLRAMGADLSDPNLKQTPERVAEAWITEFLDGYAQDPKKVLAERYPVTGGGEDELVVVTDLTFRSMCPHHLLPWSGRAAIAYVPGKEVIGFGRLAKLLDVFAHRLVLQEELARQVCKALMLYLGTKGAACILEGHQTCLRLRGGHQREAVTHAEAYAGVLTKPALRKELWVRLGAKP